MNVRPKFFQIDRQSQLAKGLVFAGLGFGPGSGAMFDASLHKNNGTLTNMDPPTDWVFVPELGRWGLDFDGSNDKISLPSAFPGVGLQALTVSAWFNLTNMSDRRTLIWMYSGVAQDAFILGARDNEIRARAGGGTNWRRSIAFTDFGNWHHVAVTSTGNTGVGVIYLDGEVPSSGTNDNAVDTAAAGFSIGIRGTAAAYPWIGRLSDVCLFKRVLFPNEVADLADPSNVYLSGLIAGRPKRRYFLPSSPAAFKAAWLARQTKIIGGGVS